MQPEVDPVVRGLIIHFPADRAVTSSPLSHGNETSEFGRPFGFKGKLSQRRAVTLSTSNARFFDMPLEATIAFSANGRAIAKSTALAERSELILPRAIPSSSSEPFGA